MINTAHINHKPGNRTTAPFDQYRELLEALSSDARLIPAITEAGERRRWWNADRIWQRTFGEFDPDQPAIVTLLYETETTPQEICMVEVFMEQPGAPSPAQACINGEDLGWLRLTRFPFDPELPTLAEALNGFFQPTVLRYRPHKRCTIRFAPPDNGGYVYAKVFPDDRGKQIHEESLAIWRAARSGELQFSVARPLGWDALTRTQWQGHVSGEPVIGRLLGPQGPDLAHRMGRVAASLTRSRLAPKEVLDATTQMKRSRRYAEELRRRIPPLAAAIELLIKKLDELHATSRRQLAPIHGSPHPHQWLDDGHRLGLVDFDRLSFGEPELDVATFLAEMDFENRNKFPIDQINAAFVAGYESIAGALDQNLLRAYRAHKMLSKALKAARAVRPDGDVRAERNLQKALNCIS